MVSFLYPYSFLLLVFLLLFFKKNIQLQINPKIIANKTNIKFKKYFLALGYIFLVIALARPVTDKKEIHTNINIKKVALALDISRSMLAEDVYPNRLTFAKHKMDQFIDKFNGQMAIMAFSNTAFLISPYTTDKDTLKYLLSNINTDYITSSGTDFQNLIKTAKKMGYTDLVVFSDGGDVKKLDTMGINLYVLLIGNKPSPIKLKDGSLLSKNGKIVMVNINKNILKYAKFGEIATNSDSDIKRLISQNFSNTTDNKSVMVYKELFIYPLALGLFFIFLGFYSLPKKVLPIFLMFFSIQAKAGVLDWHYLDEAKKAYNHHAYLKSYNLYSKIDNDQAKFNSANSLYKMGKYKEALNIYKQIKSKNLKEKTLYNIGNCYAKIGKIDEAIKSYEDALKIDPKDKDAKYNLELLKKHNKKNKKENKNKSKNNKSNKNNNSQKNKKQNNKQHKKQNNSNKNNNSKPNQNKSKKNNKQNQDNQKNKQNQNKNKSNAKKQKKVSNKKLDKKQGIKQKQPRSIQIKPNHNDNALFNKIKTQTLMLPLSKGESKDEW